MNYKEDNYASDTFQSLKKEVQAKFEEIKPKDKAISCLISFFIAMPIYFWASTYIWMLFRIQIGIKYTNEGMRVSLLNNSYMFGITGIDIFRMMPCLLILAMIIFPIIYKKVRIWRNKQLWGN